jgi:protease I
MKQVRNKAKFIAVAIAGLSILGAGCNPDKKNIRTQTEGEDEMAAKNAVMIIAPTNFRDEEYQEPRQIIENAGVNVIVASVKPGICYGTYGARAEAERSISDVSASDFDAIIFVGGNGSSVYWDNSDAHRLCREAHQQGKILAAICIAPVTLARAGVLKGRRATVWSGEKDQLSALGTEYTGADVEVDGKMITANGPHAAKRFGNKIVEMLGETR